MSRALWKSCAGDLLTVSPVLVLFALVLWGCVPGNLQGVIEALGKDNNPNCVTVGTVYGTLVIGRGSPTVAVNISGGACTMTGIQQGTGMLPITVAPTQMQLVPFK